MSEDEESFIQFEGLKNDRGEDAISSRAAFQMHTFGIMKSIQDGCPGFVSDDYLNAISAEPTLPVAELEANGLWMRFGDGYVVLDRETLPSLGGVMAHFTQAPGVRGRQRGGRAALRRQSRRRWRRLRRRLPAARPALHGRRQRSSKK